MTTATKARTRTIAGRTWTYNDCEGNWTSKDGQNIHRVEGNQSKWELNQDGRWGHGIVYDTMTEAMRDA